MNYAGLDREERSSNRNFCPSQNRSAMHMATNDFEFFFRPSSASNNFRIPVSETIILALLFLTANMIGYRCKVLLEALNLTFGDLHFSTGEQYHLLIKH